MSQAMGEVARTRFRRRWSAYALLLAALIAAAPTLICCTATGRRLVLRAAMQSNLRFAADRIRIGWFTPLELSQLSMNNTRGEEHLRIERISTNLTLWNLLGLSRQVREDWLVRGTRVDLIAAEGGFTLDPEVEKLFQDSGGQPLPLGSLRFQDLSISITDHDTHDHWKLNNVKLDLQWHPAGVEADFTGDIQHEGEAVGSTGGEVNVRFVKSGAKGTLRPNLDWDATVRNRNVPISLITLCCEQFAEVSGISDYRIFGSGSGTLHFAGHDQGRFAVQADEFKVENARVLEVRNQQLVAQNRLATWSGSINVDNDVVNLERFRLAADSVHAEIHAKASLSDLQSLPVGWGSAFSGTAKLDVDVAALKRSMPELLPLRRDVEVKSGKFQIRFAPLLAPGNRVHLLSFACEEFSAEAAGRQVELEPLKLSVEMREAVSGLHIERIHFDSPLAKLNGEGHARGGQLEFSFDLQRINAMLGPIVSGLPEELSGELDGTLGWGTEQDSKWFVQLRGQTSAIKAMSAKLHRFEQGDIEFEGHAEGRLKDASLSELTVLRSRLSSEELDCHLRLARPVSLEASAPIVLPLKVVGSGGCAALANLAHPWMPPEVKQLGGRFQFNVDAACERQGVCLSRANVKVSEPRMVLGRHAYGQPALTFDFLGELHWPSQNLQVERCELVSDAAGFSLQGTAGDQPVDLLCDWRLDLTRLHDYLDDPLPLPDALPPRSKFEFASARMPVAESIASAARISGALRGRLKAHETAAKIHFTASLDGEHVALVTPAMRPSLDDDQEPPQSGTLESFVHRLQQGGVIWEEPRLTMHCTASGSRSGDKIELQELTADSELGALQLTGGLDAASGEAKLELEGTSELRMEVLAQRLESITGTKIELEGARRTPLSIRAARPRGGGLGWEADTEIAWDSGEVAAIALGPAQVPVRLRESKLEISPTRVPAGEGHLRLAAVVDASARPLAIDVPPGRVAHEVHITPEITQRWLRFIDPPTSSVTSIDGKFSIDIDQARFVFHAPLKNRAHGQLIVTHANLEVSETVQRNLLIAKKNYLARAGHQTQPLHSLQVPPVSLPPQTVTFRLQRGMMANRQLVIDIGGHPVVCQGAVTLDGRLNMVAHLPKDVIWLGEGEPPEAGEILSIPVGGTVFEPKANPLGIGNVLSVLTSRTFHEEAKELRRQLETSKTLLESTQRFIKKHREGFDRDSQAY